MRARAVSKLFYNYEISVKVATSLQFYTCSRYTRGKTIRIVDYYNVPFLTEFQHSSYSYESFNHSHLGFLNKTVFLSFAVNY